MENKTDGEINKKRREGSPFLPYSVRRAQFFDPTEDEEDDPEEE